MNGFAADPNAEIPTQPIVTAKVMANSGDGRSGHTITMNSMRRAIAIGGIARLEIERVRWTGPFAPAHEGGRRQQSCLLSRALENAYMSVVDEKRIQMPLTVAPRSKYLTVIKQQLKIEIHETQEGRSRALRRRRKELDSSIDCARSFGCITPDG